MKHLVSTINIESTFMVVSNINIESTFMVVSNINIYIFKNYYGIY